MLSASFLALVPFFLAVNAANDWNVACTTGSCSWDLPANATSSGTLKIWGSNTAISDVTPAANWQILGCDSNALSQNIRLVCMNDPSDPDSQCSHLYDNTGAVNKIIRLPEGCGAGPFARVAAWGTSDNQDIPASLKARLVRRSGNPAVVHTLKMDTNFDAVDHSKNGAVNIAIQGANVPGAPTTINIPKTRRGLNAPTARSFGSIVSGALRSLKDGIDNAASSVKNAAEDVGDDIADAAGKAESAVENVATKAATAVKNVATEAATAVKNAATKVATAVKDAATEVAAGVAEAADNNVDVNKTFDLPPLTFDQSKNLITQSIACGPVSAALSADIDANANAQVTVTVAGAGTLVPPKLTSFGVVAGLSGSAAGTLTVKADVTGHIDSGDISLFNAGIPGFDIPGIITVGPTFQVNAKVVGDVNIPLDMTVGINLNLNNAQLAFPPNVTDPTDSSAFSLGDTPITFSATPNVAATGTITVHLIPSVNLGVSALGKTADATISLALDTNAALSMNLDASGSATKAVEPDPNAEDAAVTSAPADLSGSVGGCLNLNGGVAVAANADADFFGLFDKSTSKTLFSKDFKIFQKCFGYQAPAAATSKRFTRRTSRLTRSERQRRADFTCPAVGAASPVPVATETVAAADITEA
ncbi:hypothetical protein FB45DRAFT_843208 [Roridomyces roridus]|uniref:DUF7223 domain-containing protein n=1 Tax=Roridomyces roridus TaxID=1738132 RepID=A0AAD7FAP4_9AGAR|nr:hypothetical protein FB45DRAFT_843208 [Roridomyces roridus]